MQIWILIKMLKSMPIWKANLNENINFYMKTSIKENMNENLIIKVEEFIKKREWLIIFIIINQIFRWIKA